MDLTRGLLRAAAARPRVLVAVMPDATPLRLAAERQLRARGWPVAATPADADLLLIAGPLPPALAGPVEQTWQAMACPRARAQATGAEDVTSALDNARHHLADLDAQRADAAARTTPADRTHAQQPNGQHGGHDSPAGAPSMPEHPSGSGGEPHPGGGQHPPPRGSQREERHDHGAHHGPADDGRHTPSGAHNDEPVRHHDQEPKRGHGGPNTPEHSHHAERGDQHQAGEHAEQGHHGQHGDEHTGQDHHGGGHDGGGGGGHEGHDMHGMGGMSMPGGLPMAERGEDRDGLRLDQLHVALGPVLADWPAGLVLRLTLQGDVVQDVEVDTLTGEAGDGSWWMQPWRDAALGEPVTAGQAARRRAGAHLDSLGRLLAVAGWVDAALTARRLRDELLAAVPGSQLRGPVRRFARRVGRSWTLAWLTRGLGPVPAGAGRTAGVSGPALRADGDVTARYRQWLAEVIDDLDRLDEQDLVGPAGEGPRGRWDVERPPSAALIAVLPGLLRGVELAAVRLIVASLDPDLDELAHRAQAVAGG